MKRVLRRILAVMALMVGVGAAAATNSDVAVESADRPHVGVRAQFDLSTSITHSEFFHFGPGVSAGVVYYAPFAKRMYFNAGVLFGYDTFGYKGVMGTAHAPRPFDGHLTTVGLQVPIDLGVKFVQTRNVKLGLYTGPHLFIDFNCRAKYDYNRSGDIYKVDKKYQTPGLGIGWAVGTSIDFMKHWHAHVEYYVGFGNMAMTDDLELGKESGITRTSLSFGIGYNF